jgi:hypothetical protein
MRIFVWDIVNFAWYSNSLFLENLANMDCTLRHFHAFFQPFAHMSAKNSHSFGTKMTYLGVCDVLRPGQNRSLQYPQPKIFKCLEITCSQCKGDDESLTAQRTHSIHQTHAYESSSLASTKLSISRLTKICLIIC